MINKVTFPSPVSYTHLNKFYIEPVRFQRDTTGNQVIVFHGEPIDIVFSYDHKIKQLIIEDEDLATEEKLLELTKSLINYSGNSAVLIDSEGDMGLYDSAGIDSYIIHSYL